VPDIRPRLILFSGLGVDGRLFGPQRDLPADLEVPLWLDPADEESLPQFAERMARTIGPDDGRDLWLGGVSFGGMIALEAARHLMHHRLRGVFLIAGCRSCEGIPPLLRPLGKMASHTPLPIVRASLRMVPLLVRIAGRFTRLVRPLPVEIISQANPHLVRWGVGAVCRWQPNGEVPVPVYHIHGAIDHVLPVSRVTADAVVIRGGHLVNLTHAGTVNEFIRERLER
jgi:pimeloyl-ACP methyl ester carboxylesterase